ncbi:MAG: hypothetical protein M1400_00695 [Patescibacteria group bacterium]|nr:hypothetical protein [Patescibacteria group bacterium]
MPDDLKQNSTEKNEGVDLERLRKSAAELKTAQQAMAPKTEGAGFLGAAYMLNVAIEFAVILAVPLIAAALLGRWLAAKYHTQTYSLLLILGALLFSGIGIALDIKKLSKRIKKS